VLQYHFNWKTLSAMAGVTWWNFYFRLFPGAIKSPQVVEFLEHLMRHLPDKLLIIWDGLPSHRSHLVWDFVRQQRGRLWLEFLPAYAPELNPVEYLWSHWKQHQLPNFLPEHLRTVKRARPSRAQADAPQTHPGDGLLAASATVSIVSILCGTQ
jgi:transposase